MQRLATLEVGLLNAPAFIVDPLNCFADLAIFTEALRHCGLVLVRVTASDDHLQSVILQTKWYKRSAIMVHMLSDQVFEKSSRAGYRLLICVPTIQLLKQSWSPKEPGGDALLAKERLARYLQSIDSLERLASQENRLKNALFCYLLHSNGKEISLLETDELKSVTKGLSDYLTAVLEEIGTNETNL